MMTRRLGNYKLVRRISEGGAASVYLARMLGFGGFEKVAVVKTIHRRLTADPDTLQAVTRAARIAASLTHPNAVQIYELNRERDTFFIAMEYVPGLDLGSLVSRARRQGRGLPLGISLGIASQVSAGLHHIHERRDEQGRPLATVHRGVSPANILVSMDGVAKIADLGIARVVLDPAAKDQTQCHIAYRSVEQCLGREVDRRSDIFSLGIVLWELCTGRLLFAHAAELSAGQRITELEIPSVRQLNPAVPPEVEAVAMKALRRRPGERFQTAIEMHFALEACLRVIAPVGLYEIGQLVRELLGPDAVAVERLALEDIPVPEALTPTEGDLSVGADALAPVGAPPAREAVKPLSEIPAPALRQTAANSPALDPEIEEIPDESIVVEEAEESPEKSPEKTSAESADVSQEVPSDCVSVECTSVSISVSVEGSVAVQNSANSATSTDPDDEGTSVPEVTAVPFESDVTGSVPVPADAQDLTVKHVRLPSTDTEIFIEPAFKPTVPFEGALEAVPVPQLIAEGLACHFTGQIYLSGPLSAWIHFDAGSLTGAHSPALPVYLGAVLGELNLVDERTYRGAMLEMADSNRLVGRILVERGEIGEADLERALSIQLHRKILRLFNLKEGSYRFAPGEILPAPLQAISSNPFEIVYRGICECYEQPELARWLSALQGKACRLGPRYFEHLELIAPAIREGAETTALREFRWVSDFACRAASGKTAALKLLATLQCFGMLELGLNGVPMPPVPLVP